MAWFSLIPRHNQMDILKKLDFKDFAKFVRCSKEAEEVASGFKHRLPMKVFWIWFREDKTCKIRTTSTNTIDLEAISAIPVRLNIGTCYIESLDSQNGVSVEDFCRKAKFESKLIVFNRNDMEIDPDTMDRFINILKCRFLKVYNIPSSLLLSLTELKRLKGIHSFTGEIEEFHLLQLQTPVLTINEGGLTLSAINKFLKQWVEGKRKIKQLAIDPLPDEHMDVFKDVEYSVIWAKEAPQWEFDQHIDIQKIYSIRREDGRKLAVAMEKWDMVKLLAKEYEELGEVKRWIEKFYGNARSDSE